MHSRRDPKRLVEVKTHIGPCLPERLPEVASLLDQEFVFGRGRIVSLVKRYPELFVPENIGKHRVALIEGQIASIALARTFSWSVSGRIWKGSMIGFVFTRPELRKRGLATRVLLDLKENLVKEKTDFAVLWTTSPTFYERLGWIPEDESLYGEAVVDSFVKTARTDPAPLTRDRIAFIERVRGRWMNEQVVRSESSYRNLPLPATSLEAFVVEKRGREGYALVGHADEDGYLYEWAGSPATLLSLWDTIRPCYERFFVNEREGSPGCNWLVVRGKVRLCSQGHAMWSFLSSAARKLSLPHFIPYFDRI